MRYAVIDVYVDLDTMSVARKQYDNNHTGYSLDEACELMKFITKQNPDTHYPYMVYWER